MKPRPRSELGRASFESLGRAARALTLLACDSSTSVTALSAEVTATLKPLGMVDAFEGGNADLSGMDGTRILRVQDVVHEDFVSIDERGPEAAAATAVVVGRTCAPEPATFTADRPFLVVIRDQPTGAVLSLGEVTVPGTIP